MSRRIEGICTKQIVIRVRDYEIAFPWIVFATSVSLFASLGGEDDDLLATRWIHVMHDRAR